MFYLHKGDVDAAISRFEHAISLRANFAKPRLLLAECYEKKGDPSEAVRYYKEYLQVLPNAPDAKKVREKIEKLSEEVTLHSKRTVIPNEVPRFFFTAAVWRARDAERDLLFRNRHENVEFFAATTARLTAPETDPKTS